jgi:hypothetical protein
LNLATGTGFGVFTDFVLVFIRDLWDKESEVTDEARDRGIVHVLAEFRRISIS